jgi:hypothetical protein
LTFNLDSSLGVQATLQATQQLSSTPQLRTMHRTKDNIDVETEWAFLKFEPIDRLALRAGRMALPTFAISDFRNVGYANTWMRPPAEVYGLALLQRLEGADVSYRFLLRSSSVLVTVLDGKSSFVDVADYFRPVHRVTGINAQWEVNGLSIRIGRVKGKVDVGIQDPYTFSGIVYDANRIVAQGEYAQRRSERLPQAVDTNGWYVLNGCRFGSWLPYLIYGDTRPLNDNSPIYISGKQTTLSAGVRWNAWNTAATKFQFDHVNTHGIQGISFDLEALHGATPLSPPIDASIKSPVNVASLSINFVF